MKVGKSVEKAEFVQLTISKFIDYENDGKIPNG